MAPIPDQLINTYELGPDKERVQHEVSVARTGEKVIQILSTEELIQQHLQNIHHIDECSRDSNTRWAKQITIPNAYAPSMVPLEKLQQIPLSALALETHHRGSFITASTITPAYQFSTTTTLVQDASNTVAVLVLGFQDDSVTPIPQNSTVAIKEPYVKYHESAGWIIRVDHPSDIAVLRGDDPAVTMIMKFVKEKRDVSGEEWRKQGDGAFLEGKFGSAVECYTQALSDSLSKENLHSSQDVYRKRAFANLMSQRYQQAKEDSLASCSGTDLDAKAYFTAGKACYALRSFVESKTYLEKALELNPSDMKARKELNRVLIRLEEHNTGNYDFARMIQEQESNIWLDHADFTSKVEVRPTNYAGRGLFTTKDVEGGELLMCEKAFCLPNQYTGDEASDTVLFNFNNGTRTQKSGQALVFQNLVQQLYKNPEISKVFYDLDSGSYVRNGDEGKVVDGVPVVDAFLVESIRLKNCFSAPKLSRNLLKRNCPAHETNLTTAIWHKASYTNHSCVPNCGRAFIGDFMTLRALHAIPAGTELTHQYSAPDASTLFRREAYLSNWDFDCTCRLCAGEKKIPDENHVKRTELAKKIKAEAMKFSANGRTISMTNVKAIEKMMRKLEDMYEPSIYASLPRLLLVHPSIWLMEASRKANNTSKMVKFAIEVLKNFGFGSKIVDAVNEKVELDWEGGIVNTEVFNSLRNAAEGYDELGRSELAEGCRSAARRMYVVLAGCDVGIEKFFSGNLDN
ncbi:SET [Glarea lozoyensis ATCC 20868]|uniref:SET n=1 Tax=Glarea lozoyensis (strain ATCC 20868 / MF5171) TaxID=1116229 RepID=S3E7R5_GLAL2|nr:SET [Glarea lozoyensis ATCC 20868]EPE34368.1 SET [Glarea lozoyensis ATCC 20868]